MITHPCGLFSDAKKITNMDMNCIARITTLIGLVFGILPLVDASESARNVLFLIGE